MAAAHSPTRPHARATTISTSFRASLGFLIAAGLLLALHVNEPAGAFGALDWAAALAAGVCAALFAKALLSLVIIALPPGLLIASVVAMLG